MTDFVKLFSYYKIPFFTKKNKGWINTACPRCGSSDNLGFNEENGYASCWSCGWMPVEKGVADLLDISETRALEIINEYTSGVNKIEKTVKKNAKNIVFPGKPFTEMEKNYLIGRKFNPESLSKKYGIQGGGIAGKWSYRILIPLVYQNKLISWTGRSILPKETCEQFDIPRYLNLKDEDSIIDPKTLWFNFDNAKKDYVILVEGPMDVLRFGDDTISGWGSTITEAQKLKLSKFKKIIILFDNDKTGIKKADLLQKDLTSLGFECHIANDLLGDFSDPGSLTPYLAKQLKRFIIDRFNIQ